jgi:hypothetical protein
MKYTLITLIFLSSISESQLAYHGTTVAFVRTKDTIIVAADSKERMQGNSSHPFNLSRSINKIRTKGNIAFAVAGLSAYSSTHYDAYKIIESAIDRYPSILDLSYYLLDNFTDSLTDTWKYILRSDPVDDFSNRCVRIMLFGFFRDTVTVAYLEFLPTKQSTYSISWTPHAGFAPYRSKDDSTYSGILSSSPITEDSVLDSRSFRTSDPKEYVRRIIQKAILLDSLNNGYPITILCLTRSGFNWIK